MGRMKVKRYMLWNNTVGVPIKDNENTNGIVVEVAKLANVQITKDQISTPHRLAAKPKRNAIDQAAQSLPPIIVRFISRNIRNRLCANRQNLCNAYLKIFPQMVQITFTSITISPATKKNYSGMQK